MNKNAYQYTNILYNDCKTFQEDWTEEEINHMFATLQDSQKYLKTIWGDWMKARDLCIMALMRYLLLRPREACWLKFSDFKNGRIKIRGENNKEKKDRPLPIPEKLKEYISFYLSFPRWMWKGSDYLFPSAENEKLSPERWKHIFREKILKPSGLYEPKEGTKMPRTRSYLFRQSGATQLLDKTNNPWLVAQVLGHSDLRTVKKYLFNTKKFREKQKEALNLLG